MHTSRTATGFLISGAAIVLLTGCSATAPAPSSTPSASSFSSVSSPVVSRSSAARSSEAAPALSLRPPLTSAIQRVTKKRFGTYVTPQQSPVNPERFTGFHTGVDFEAFPEERKTDVSVSAICAGRVRVARFVSGYGGVAIQECRINDEPVTVLYGHLRLASIKVKADDTLAAGDVIGVLGEGYGPETDGERMHLHLGIHRGTAIELRGYVGAEAELRDWMDPMAVLGL